MDLTPTLFGLLVGFLVGLTGVGGGSLMTPFLIAVVGVSAPTAVGTDMVFATLTKFTGSLQHYRQQSVNLEIASFLGLGSIPAGLLGVATLEWIEGSFDAETVRSIMITIIAITLVIVGASLIFRNFMPERREGPKPGVWDGKGRMSNRRRYYTVVFGAMGGYLVGLTSIGSGSVATAQSPSEGAETQGAGDSGGVVQTGPGEVPDVSGRDVEEAARRLSRAGYEVAAIQTVNSAEQAGKVLRTQPAVGTKAEPGTPVFLVMSGGPAGQSE